MERDQWRARFGQGLTAREVELFTLVMDGMLHREIAAMLVISPRTVDGTICQVRTKLGARTTPQAVAIYLRQRYEAMATASVIY